MSIDRFINVRDVESVLMLRKMGHLNWSALCGHTDTGACGTSWRHSRPHREYLGLKPEYMRPFFFKHHNRDLVQLIKNTRTMNGLDEVKRTLGLRYKAILAELGATP